MSESSEHPLEAISALHDGALSAAQAAPVRTHLAVCSSCRQHLADLQQLSQALRDEPTPAAPIELLRAKIQRGLAPRRRTLPAGALAAAALVVGAVLVGVLMREPVPQATAPPPPSDTGKKDKVLAPATPSESVLRDNDDSLREGDSGARQRAQVAQQLPRMAAKTGAPAPTSLPPPPPPPASPADVHSEPSVADEKRRDGAVMKEEAIDAPQVLGNAEAGAARAPETKDAERALDKQASATCFDLRQRRLVWARPSESVARAELESILGPSGAVAPRYRRSGDGGSWLGFTVAADAWPGVLEQLRARGVTLDAPLPAVPSDATCVEAVLSISTND